MKMDLVRKSDVLKLIDSVEFDADADYYVDDILNDLRLWVQALEPVNAKKEVQKMPEYIRKQAVLNLIDDLEFGNAIAADYDNVHEFQKLYDAVESIPPADVAPVVRCKDCENAIMSCDEFGSMSLACMHWTCEESVYPVFVDEDDFCSRGIKREGVARHGGVDSIINADKRLANMPPADVIERPEMFARLINEFNVVDIDQDTGECTLIDQWVSIIDVIDTIDDMRAEGAESIWDENGGAENA